MRGEDVAGQGVPDFVQILAAWGLAPMEIRPVRAAYRVVTGDGIVALKPARDDPERLLVIDEACRYLAARGFHQTPPLLPTRAGEPYLEWGGERWTVSPWIQGREAAYLAPGEMARCASALAAFHLAGLGFRPSRGHVRWVIGKWPAKLRSRTAELRKRLEQARAAAWPTEFEELLADLGTSLVEQAQSASDALARTAYARRCACAALAHPLCHGDPSDRNFLLGEDGLVRVIDLAALKYDLPELDLARFLRRMMRRADWDFPAGREMLEAYGRQRPLTPSAREIVCAVLRFPDKAWRLVKQYYRDDGVATGKKAARLAGKLRTVARQLPRQESFLQLLASL